MNWPSREFPGIERRDYCLPFSRLSHSPSKECICIVDLKYRASSLKDSYLREITDCNWENPISERRPTSSAFVNERGTFRTIRFSRFYSLSIFSHQKLFLPLLNSKESVLRNAIWCDGISDREYRSKFYRGYCLENKRYNFGKKNGSTLYSGRVRVEKSSSFS